MSEKPVRKWNLKRNLIAGLIVIAPVTVTAAVLYWIFQTVDGLLGQFLNPALPFPIPGLGLVTLLAILLAVGWMAERAIGSRVVAWWHSTLERIPVTRRIYSAANRIVRTVFAEEDRPFKTVVLAEWPGPGRYSIGFLSGPAPEIMRAQLPGAISVFIPTTPNPTTGFLTVMSPDQITVLNMSVDEAFTFILSAGAVSPTVAAPAPARTPRRERRARAEAEAAATAAAAGQSDTALVEQPADGVTVSSAAPAGPAA